MRQKKLFASLLLGSAILAGALSFLSGATKRGANREQYDQLEIKNETSSLKVASVSRELSGDEVLLTLSLMNVSDKSVVAYTLLKQNTTMLTTNGATTGWILGPGATDRVPLVLPVSDKKLTIRAAVFDDGSGEGNPQEVSGLLAYQIGVKAQYEHAIPILRKLQNSIRQDERFSSMKTLLDLPDKQDEILPDKRDDINVSMSKLEGAKHAKQFLLEQLKLSNESLRDLREPSHSQIDETFKTLEKAMARLAASTKGRGL